METSSTQGSFEKFLGNFLGVRVSILHCQLFEMLVRFTYLRPIYQEPLCLQLIKNFSWWQFETSKHSQNFNSSNK